MRGQLPPEYVAELIRYDATSGHFFWRKPRPFCSAGKRAGTTTRYGYEAIALEGRKYLAHRLAWLLTYGAMPDGEIDHINGDRRDNRILNLRLATPSQNQANKLMRSDNTSGVKGVTWDKSRRKWMASIHLNGCRIGLGRFEDIHAAADAYSAAAKEMFGEYARPERRI